MQRLNPRLRTRPAAATVALLACSALLMGGPGVRSAHGQAAPAVPPPVVPTPIPPPVKPLSDAVKKATAPLTAAQTQEVAAYVNGHFANLPATGPNGTAVNPTTVTIAIKGIADGSASGTPFFTAGYSQAVSLAVPKALNTADVRSRVSVGVAVSRVAALGPSEKLAPAIAALLADKSAPVAAMGVKSARTVYPMMLGIMQKDADSMARQILVLLRAHGKSSDALGESLSEDAFEALAGDAVTGPTAPAPARYRNAFDSILLLLHTRAELWGANSAVAGDPATYPPLPNLETKPLLFLSTRTWNQLTKEQKASAGRAMFDLAVETNRLAPLTPAAPLGQSPPGVWQKDLYDLQKQALASIEVAAGTAPGNPPVVIDVRACTPLVGAPANSVVLDEALKTLEASMKTANLIGVRPALPTAPVAPVGAPPKPGTAPATAPKTAPGTPAKVPGGGAALNK